MDHLARCGRLIFGDLLIYMDCFSLLLEGDGFVRDIGEDEVEVASLEWRKVSGIEDVIGI
mgnify:CR=1 FL=1